MKYADAFGQPIAPGDYIVYAGAAGRSSVFHFGKVMELSVRKNNPEAATVKIVGAEIDWRGEYERHQKIDTLGFLDRLLVVPGENVPHDLKALLDASDDELCWEHHWMTHLLSKCPQKKVNIETTQ